MKTRPKADRLPLTPVIAGIQMRNFFATCIVAASVFRIGAIDYIFNNFTNTANLALNGNAVVTNTADGFVIRLVTSEGWETGSVFSTLPVQVSSFSANFKFRITNSGGGSDGIDSGADGLAFIIQAVSTNALGSYGGYLGYAGIPAGITNSIDIEFDTWYNPEFHDPDSNHLGINTNGVADHGVGSPYTVHVDPRFDDGNLWFAWVDYDGTNVQVSANELGVRPQSPNLIRPLNATNLIGNTNAFVGFSSGTGDGWENVDVLSFEYHDNAIAANLPVLQVSSISTNSITISWPISAIGFTLQENSYLPTTNWIDVTNTINVIGDQDQVNIPTTSGNRFYRLKR